MGVTTIQDAKVLISSSRVTERTTGLKELIQILRHNRGKTAEEILTNRAYLALCETIFQCMRDERSAFLRSKAKLPKTVGLLSLAATALRHIVNTGVRVFKVATVEAIIDSIIELLPGRNGELLPPLVEDLAKVLRALLEYQPHVERLPQDCWEATVDFCLDSLATFLVDPEADAQNSTSTTASPRDQSQTRTQLQSTDATASRTSLRDLSMRKSIPESVVNTAEDLIHCLHSLTRASNAPILGRAEPILSTLTKFLHRRAARSLSAALSSVNAVLARVVVYSTPLAKRTIQDLLPLMRTLWSQPLLRDEILIILMHTEAHLCSILSAQGGDATASNLEALVDVMYGEYRQRKDHGGLQILGDDHVCLRIGNASGGSHPLHTRAFSMQTEHARFEPLWGVVSAIAHFSSLLDDRQLTMCEQREDHGEGGREGSVSKKQRTMYKYHEYLRHASTESRSNAKRAALQVLAFMLQEGPLNEEDLEDTVDRLTTCISDENPAHSSWAMIALSAAAFQPLSKTGPLRSPWISAWLSASRTVTSVSSSRAACHLMDVSLKLNVVPFSSVSAHVQSMLLSVERNFPALLTEASAALMTTIIRQRAAENPSHYSPTAERVLTWLMGKWTPSLWLDRTYSAPSSNSCDARDILGLVQICLARPHTDMGPSPLLVSGPVSQAKIQTSSSQALKSYLLILPDSEPFQLSAETKIDVSFASNTECPPTFLEARLLDHCISELEKSSQSWKEGTQNGYRGMTSDMLRAVFNLCIVASALGSLSGLDQNRVHILESAVNQFTQSLADVLAKREMEQYKVDAVIELCIKNLPDVNELKQLSTSTFKLGGLYLLAKHLSKALDSRREQKDSFNADEDDDFMDIDDRPSSQMIRAFSVADEVPRHVLQAESDIAALRAILSAYCHLITHVSESPTEECYIPEGFVDYVTSIPESELLRCRALFKALLSAGLRLRKASCVKLLERLMERLLDPLAREYNTSEVAHCMAVDILIGTASQLDPSSTDHEDQELYDMAESLYLYYVEEMENTGVRRSPNLQKVIADLLHDLLKRPLEFQFNNTSPSVRTRLFELLKYGELEVKWHIAARLPSILAGFPLPEHDKILEQIESSLPSEKEWPEGLALTLFALSRLASEWHTLLRQGVYRVFAAAGSSTLTAQHARRCLDMVASCKDLDGSKALFRLLAPQIVFTWLDRKRKFSELPFLAFDYASIEALIRDIETEAVGQAIMLSLKEELEYLAQLLGVSTAQVLIRNIGKANAYTISWDTCKGTARTKSEPGGMALLRELVGPQQYATLILERSARVVGHILQTMNNEERINKCIEKKILENIPAEKKAVYAATAKALKEMTTFGHCAEDFDLGIEPSFSAFYYFDQIDRLCRRTNEDPNGFWNAKNYTFAMRMLLDRLHPALGPLHARSIIRKVRILVAHAGRVAYEGYPLQMTLQSLRPFLTDMQCAEDVFGIVQYLFEHGQKHLRTHLTFVTGIGLSILISTRVFLASSPESDTQGSQHTTGMSKVRGFHQWFVQYLKVYAGMLSLKEASTNAFDKITAAAASIKTEGNSMKNSEESELLLQILDDMKSGRKLLSNTSREVALDLLCRNFQPAPSPQDDVLQSDDDIADYAPHVWQSCLRRNIGDGYMLWAARVLGRAFSAHGEVKRKLIQQRPWSADPASSRISGPSSDNRSRDEILRKVCDVFYSDDRREVGLAETAVRNLICRLSRSPTYKLNIPQHIGGALHLFIPTDAEGEHTVPAERLGCVAYPPVKKSPSIWVRDLAVALCHEALHDPILGSISRLVLEINGMAGALFPYILHLVLLVDFEADRSVRRTFSEAMKAWFSVCDAATAPYVRILLQAILYLRSQPVPNEVTIVERDRWLDIDYLQASRAAVACKMYNAALLFAETSTGQPQPSANTTSRRSSARVQAPIQIGSIPVDLLLLIFRNLDEPDSFYGVERGFSLSSVLDRLDHESDGLNSLLYRGARVDSQMRRSNTIEYPDSRGMMQSLINLNMNSITQSLLLNDKFRDTSDDGADSALHTARRLGQWDVRAPEGKHGESVALFEAFQGLHNASGISEARLQLNQQMLATMKLLSDSDRSFIEAKSQLRTLAVLTEAGDVISTPNPGHLSDLWHQMKSRERWMRTGEYDDVRLILSCRETFFSILNSNPPLRESLHVMAGQVQSMEVEALMQTSTLGRKHGALQESLASVTYLSDIVEQCKSVGLDIDATVQNETANVLWDQGEAETSIRMRQLLVQNAHSDPKSTDISLPVLLAKLGHHVTEARLAKPDTIIQDYLEPAVQELKGQHYGTDPGQVFHDFALFCDKQLQSAEAADELACFKVVMDRKKKEQLDFLKLAKVEPNKHLKDTYRRNAVRAQIWHDLDGVEYDRLHRARQQYLQQCLENYLLCLKASDDYNNDVLRVFSLWLEFSDSPLANEAVRRRMPGVPSGKFALLMNQLSSRLQAEETLFQKLLTELVYRICREHPYHGMYQMFAMQMKVAQNTAEGNLRSRDETARSRQRAAGHIAMQLKRDRRAGDYWQKIYRAAELYHALAMLKEPDKTCTELLLDKHPASKAIFTQLPGMNVPPATLHVEVRSNCDYSDLPTIIGFKPTMSIANGISAPKVVTAFANDGNRYKQLFKSGNDDLRQDAIMEQVFDQVSRLLKNHTTTRLRSLGIRTYKVLPLSTRSGLMEFVQDTIPLNNWLMPAHEKYYPSDYKPDKCRREIANCQTGTTESRIRTWQKLAKNFHPVLRFFFMERFVDPDEWFEKRLAYTRSTAAISILGHVLGLGDRHCHNILLDEKTGEVVHIDLGVSFEAGRILPVPEVVPFRLTRDLVDAMGHTKTEGVFRRCCEFTMDTLREERDSIMTLLNVLRYDPLVNWSITPAKAKRMQQEQDMANANGTGTVAPMGAPVPTPGGLSVGVSAPVDAESARKEEEQEGEAGRALAVVERKLSKMLSTHAIVNDLIQTATDERNLAVLYCGWSSYA